ncbi:hypothetical protein [Sphingomonas radiodurans]|uniref:hypothetical protein n=1 Tax=Sphingomonas radiodurans TaxID=2890321 RepID=UPI001E46A4CC|nr:hypothetical protein [Sphingomonas radiodurans]WBH15048.1 hypothetical protein LLW23_09210 [Sphingomonas radiodurans]
MQLTFTKRAGKYDDLLIERDGHAPETIACPKQGIIPHDMVHFAVESALGHRGFLSHVADGAAPAFGLTGGATEEAVERLVETFQAELWGGRVDPAALIATYEHACGARGHAIAPITPDDVAAIRARLDTLGRDWAQVPVGGALALRF